jgi:hypothetical protein
MTHQLEDNLIERARFNAYASTNERAAWRRAIEVATGSLPTWAERKRPGRKPNTGAASA